MIGRKDVQPADTRLRPGLGAVHDPAPGGEERIRTPAQRIQAAFPPISGEEVGTQTHLQKDAQSRLWGES